MAKGNPLSPEKQLLNLIEKPNSQDPLRTKTIKNKGLRLFSWGVLKSRLSFFKAKFAKPKEAPKLDIRAINVILKFLVVLLVIYLGLNLYFSVINLKKGLSFKIKVSNVAQAGASSVSSPLKAPSYYLEKARERDIFSMGARKSDAASSKGPSSAIIEVTQDLRLVGISWSGDPDVMIEDTKHKRTFFLKKGQTIDNEIKIQAIFKDKVILNYKGEEIELK